MKTPQKAKKSPFLEYDGELYVKVKYAGMHYLSLIVDCVPISLFGKTPYLKIDDAIQWHEKEIEATGGAWKRCFLDTHLKAKQDFLEDRRK